MAYFVSQPKGERVSGKTIEVAAGSPVRIGLADYADATGDEAFLTHPAGVRSNTLSDAKGVRVYGVWDLPAGDTRVEAVNDRRAVLDAVTLRAVAPKVSGGNRQGVVPDAVLDACVRARRKWRVPISVTLAQWALESTWGTSTPPGSNNPFGIKAGKGQAGVTSRTREEDDAGASFYIDGNFRKFATLDEAFDEHARLLATHPVYAGAMAHTDDPDKFAEGLTRYAKAHNYVASLKNWMKVYDMYQYDKYGGFENHFFRDEVQFPKD